MIIIRKICTWKLTYNRQENRSQFLFPREEAITYLIVEALYDIIHISLICTYVQPEYTSSGCSRN